MDNAQCFRYILSTCTNRTTSMHYDDSMSCAVCPHVTSKKLKRGFKLHSILKLRTKMGEHYIKYIINPWSYVKKVSSSYLRIKKINWGKQNWQVRSLLFNYLKSKNIFILIRQWLQEQVFLSVTSRCDTNTQRREGNVIATIFVK